MTAPAIPIVLRWTPQRADLDDALAVYRRAMGGRAIVFPFIPAFAMLLVGFALLVADEQWFALFCVLAAVLFALFGNRITARAVWRNPLIRQPIEAVVSPEAIRMTSPNATTDWRWHSFARAVETDRSFVLLSNPDAVAGRKAQLFCYLPKAALPHPTEVDRLRAALGAMLPGGVKPR